jgi:glycosyltransferase involved in cell wall biosynthesis
VSAPSPVAFVGSAPDPYHPRHYHLLAAGLVRAGVPAIVVSPPGRTTAPGGLVPVVLAPARRSRLARMFGAPGVLIKALRRRPGAVQITNLDLLPWAVVARVISRQPFIYDAYEDYAAYMLIKDWLPRPLRVPASRAVGFLEPWLASRLDAVITADRGTARRFSGSSPLVVHNFPRRALTELPRDSDERYDLVYHGSVPDYHVDRFVAIAHRLRDRGVEARWCLVVAGYGEGRKQRLRERLAAEGLADAFSLFFDLPFSEIPGLLAGCRIGVVPLPDELKFRHNIPMKLFEFMALGCAAVASDLPPVRELVDGSGACELVTPGDDAGFADAIAELLADTERRRRMGERGRELVRTRLNAETELKPYLALCRRLLEAERSRQPSRDRMAPLARR